MKKISKIFIATVLAMVAISCAKEELNIDKVPVTMVKQTLYAYTDDGLVSKTQLAGLNVVWNENDAITAFDANGNGYNATVEKSDFVDEGKEGTMGKFTFEVSEGTTLKTAVYPAGGNYTYDGDYIYAELPSVQTAVKGNFADGVNLALANVPSDLTQPFKFSNATGLLCLGVKTDGTTNVNQITSLTLSADGEDGAYLAGGVKASVYNDAKVTVASDDAHGFSKSNSITLNGPFTEEGDYYFCALPGTYRNLKMVFTRDDYATATYTNPNTLPLGINDNLLIGRLTIPETKWVSAPTFTWDLTEDETASASVDALTWESLNFDMSINKSGAQTNANNYYPGKGSSSTRFYKNSALSISQADGSDAMIRSIVFNATSEGYASALANSNWTNASASASDKTVTITPTDGTKGVSAKIGDTCGFENVTITYTGGKEYVAHNINVESSIEGGTVTASTTSAIFGTEITLTPEAAEGYSFTSWNVTYGEDGTITPVNNKFTMPDCDVNVSAVFTANDTPSGHIFYESFNTNEGTGGNDGKWSGGIASSELKTDNVWSTTNGYGANACAKFGASKSGGSAITPEITLSGNATLKFKAGAWNASDEKTTLSISAENATLSKGSVTLAKGQWTEYEIAITGVTTSKNIKIKFSTSAGSSRFFLDEVAVDRAATLESVAVSENPTNPTKKKYVAGESFDPAGLIVTGTYSDNSMAEITDGIDWISDPDPLTSGTTSVSVIAKVGTITSEPYTVNGLTVASVISVESVSIDESEINLTEKEIATLTATISPTGATNQKISWSSSSTSVATVVAGENNTAKVTAIAGGTATITVTTDDGDKTATCTVKVTALPRYKVTVESPTGGTITASSDENILAGTEISLTQTASKGYEFTEWNVTDNNGSVTVTDNKFTMPASDVTVSATFSQIEYTISKSSENGTFTVKVNGVESSKAHYNDNITLEPSADEGYDFSKFTYKKDGNGNSYQINNNELTMPNSNITITAEFVKGVPTFNSVEEFIQSEEYKSVSGTNQTVKVQFNNVISELYYYSGKVAGVYLKDTDVLIYCNNTPTTYSIGGTISTSEPIVCTWKQYKELKELCPSSWNDFTFTAPKLSSIEITSESHRNFIVGGTFVGESVKAKYDTGYEKEVTATFSGFNMSQAGIQTVTASYTEGGVTKTTTYQITVSAPVLESISVSENHRTFNVGDTFVKETVTAHYEGGATKVVDGATFSGYNMSTAGEQTVMVTYSESGVEKTTSYKITISNYTAQELKFTYSSHTGWTVSAQDKSTYYLLNSGKYIISPEIEYSKITSITVKTRTFGGNSYKTTAFYLGTSSTPFSSVNATSTDFASITAGSENSPLVTTGGKNTIKFASTTTTTANGPGISEITIKYIGKEISGGDTPGGGDDPVGPVELSAETKSTSNLPSGWSGSGSGSSYIQLTSSSNFIQSPEFECQNIVSITLKARKYGGPSDTQAKITVTFGNTVLGTITPTNTTLTDYTISSPAAVSGKNNVKIECRDAGSSKGSGVSEVKITYTPIQ